MEAERQHEAPAAVSGDAETGLDLLTAILAEASQENAPESARAQLNRMREQVLRGEIESPQALEAMLASQVAEIDDMLSAQVNEILHAPAFQALEASWRGLHYLVSNCDTGSMLKVRVLNATKDDLRRDLEDAIEFDMSVLFQKIYEEEYGRFGGEPFGALIADYEFAHEAEDVALLERFGNVAAAAHAPLICGASPELFNWSDFADLATPRDLAKIFGSAEYIKWRAFRDSEDSRYVALTLPRILLRPPYDPDTLPVESFCFREDVSGADSGKHLWGSAAYAFGVCLAAAFTRHGWFALIRGTEGGRLENLPVALFDTGETAWVTKSPTDVSIPDLREKELADLGLLPLVHSKDTGEAVFYSAQSCQKPRRYDTEEASVSAQLSTQLQYLFCVSRFAHYLKVMMRDKIGSGTTASEIETYLSRWLSDYSSQTRRTSDLKPELASRSGTDASRCNRSAAGPAPTRRSFTYSHTSCSKS